jgi:hypothetical protein
VSVTVKVTVPPDLKRALDGDMRKVVQRASVPITRELHSTVSEYPPASAANAPNHRWYERGYGPRWSRKDGSIGGSKTSEMLNRSWGIARKRWGMVLGSRASYSPVVHHHKEQARFHKARGWVTDKMAVDKLLKSGKVERIVRAAVKAVLKGRR